MICDLCLSSNHVGHSTQKLKRYLVETLKFKFGYKLKQDVPSYGEEVLEAIDVLDDLKRQAENQMQKYKSKLELLQNLKTELSQCNQILQSSANGGPRMFDKRYHASEKEMCILIKLNSMNVVDSVPDAVQDAYCHNTPLSLFECQKTCGEMEKKQDRGKKKTNARDSINYAESSSEQSIYESD